MSTPSGGNGEKTSKISRHFMIFRNRYETKRRDWLQKGAEAGEKGTGSGSKRYGRREVQTPLSPSTMNPVKEWDNIR